MERTVLFSIFSFFQLSCVHSLPLTREFLSNTNDTAEEIQHAICQISSKELEASANATITRQLKGVCTSRQLNTKLDILEIKILREIDSLKNMLLLNGFDNPESKTDTPDSFGHLFVLKNVSERPSPSILLNRNEEISLYNDTVSQSNGENIYFYYWRVLNFQELSRKEDMYISSPEFHTLGHTLHLQFYPNYLEKKYFGVQLRPSSKGFLKKHRIRFLNKFNKNLDLQSEILYGLRIKESMFRTSLKEISDKGFLNGNSLIIKVEIYLNS